MEGEPSIMVVQSELKILLPRITMVHYSASLKVLNRHPCDGIVKPHLTVPLKVLIIETSHLLTKPTKWHVRPAKTQISLGIRPF